MLTTGTRKENTASRQINGSFATDMESFSSYRALAIMVGHKLMHVYHNVSGMRLSWDKRMVK